MINAKLFDFMHPMYEVYLVNWLSSLVTSLRRLAFPCSVAALSLAGARLRVSLLCNGFFGVESWWFGDGSSSCFLI